MCFIVPNYAKEHTAKEDIAVYKVIYKDNRSQYQNFQYTPDTTYRLKKKLKIINNGYDGYINNGFHSYINVSNNKNMYVGIAYKVVKFIIPKGAKYYINKKEGEYVSTSIRSENLKRIKKYE